MDSSISTGNPQLIVLSGPSGVGKDAVFGRLRDQGRPYHFTITATTRPRRSSERDGIDYIFLTDDSGLGNEHLAPTVGDYQVEFLNDLLERIIREAIL